jgi:hypothetical protein
VDNLASTEITQSDQGDGLGAAALVPTSLVVFDPASIPLRRAKWERYARERALCNGRLQAARTAGLDPRSGICTRLERNQTVLARIAYLTREADEILAEKRRRLEEREWLIHDCSIENFYETVTEPILDDDYQPVIGKDGQPKTRTVQRLKLFSELPPELLLVVEGLTFTEKGKPNLKLYSKQDANRELRKMLGLNVEKPAGNEEFDRLSDHDLLTELARQAAELGIDVKISFEKGPAPSDEPERRRQTSSPLH